VFPEQLHQIYADQLAAPAGQTCGDYAGAFADAVGGYINNPGSEGDCQFCQYRVGDSFYNNLNITYDTRWRDFGIFVSPKIC
jgi:ABC-type multidrug transport system permease subunit